MKEADIFPIEVDLTIPALHGSGNNENDDIDNENDESNGNSSLFNDEQQEGISNQQKLTEDVDLLNIGQ